MQENRDLEPIPAGNQRPGYDRVFWGLMLGAFLIRVWGIWNVSTTDEYNEVIEALRVCSGHFNLERWIKRFYLYILAVEYGFYYIGGWIFQAFSSPSDFAEKIVRNMEPLFILGRVTSAIAGTLTVGVVYQIGAKFFNLRTAFIASILMTLTVFHVDLSQQVRVDALLGLLVVATFYFILKILVGEKTNKWDFAWCGFFMALAVQTKINSVVLIVPFAITVLYRHEVTKTRLHYLLVFFASFFILGFILGNPPILLAPFKFIKGVLALGSVYTTPVNVVPNDLIGFLAYPLYYYRGLGVVISVIAILAILFGLYRPNKQRTVLLSFIAAFYILMGSTKNLVSPSYMIPALPFIFLLIGDFLCEMSNRFVPSKSRFNSIETLSLILLMIFGLIKPALNVAYHELSLSGENTRYLAKNWIEENIPAGSKILMDSGKSINSFAPPIAENKETLERILREARENVKRGKIVHAMVDENAIVYYELLLKTIPETSYDITSTMFGLEVKSVEYYVSNHYQYFIISETMKSSRTNEFSQKNLPEVAKFYSSLDIDKRIELIKVFRPSLVNSGDTFYIYRVINS